MGESSMFEDYFKQKMSDKLDFQLKQSYFLPATVGVLQKS